jgi:hypothetical protein
LECHCLWIRYRDPRKKEERAINAFEIWYWRGMLKIKWACRITHDEVLQKAKKKDCFKNVKKQKTLMDRAYN